MTTCPVELTANLIRCPSVTPDEGGALVLLADLLGQAGFECTRVDRNGTPNLFARWGAKGAEKSFGFNGHTDVVPVGDVADWTYDPFGAQIDGPNMYGRGACDMKSGVAAFAAAAVDFVQDKQPDGAIILTITGDEEGPARDGTVALLDWMDANGERMSDCLVGEPTCPNEMGEMIKIGRRGSLTAKFTIIGQQGHVAYPHRARTPMAPMVRLMDRLASHTLDTGTDHFDPSTLQITTIDTGNAATNVIPNQVKSTINIRFNDAHTGDSLIAWLRAEADKVAAEFNVEVQMTTNISGDSFVTEPGAFSRMIVSAVQAVTGKTPEMSTSGGTSDARFVKNHCPVVECGLVGTSMHQVDEYVVVEQIHQLKEIYTRILTDYFA
ncbi:succinyl-diaminopimelate desuccinylase [Donghicola sp. C2-DW-16]|uniref:Succinyl-diaminopimelate desuccinylase n=1 Tax=Donghicola mangrovi TaxID=2729614 RepID=A0ABX2P9X6_9RHOB|nr:succinyl-diaminopimelate desuccinylase [Donghicola mangrovi]NVO26277.1 succinyl-diaminopimelate desuccinylase [Donghicola mangrovi]